MLAEVEITTPFRCNRCWSLEARGVRTKLCNICGYTADIRTVEPERADLEFDPRRAHRDLLTLSPEERERFDYWMELTLAAGWQRSVARSGAFRRARQQLT